MLHLNTLFFATGFLGFLATMLLDTIMALAPDVAGAAAARDAIDGVLGAAAPHYGLARGLYEVAENFKSGGADVDPFAWGATGKLLGCMAAQGPIYMAVLLLLDGGLLQRLQRKARGWQSRRRRGVRAAEEPAERHGQAAAADPVAVEVRPRAMPAALPCTSACCATSPGLGFIAGWRFSRLQSVPADTSSAAVLLAGVGRTYPGTRAAPAVHAVRGVHLAVPPGECFGLLGHNGAGKTTTLRMLTGEEVPDEGDAYVAGASAVLAPAAVCRLVGYCPQHNAAPEQMTAREVLRMFAALRGLPAQAARPTAARLLRLLGLEDCADR